MVTDIRMDDVVQLRKPHPCGGYTWRVVRIGADIGMKCDTCGRRVLLSRREFDKRVKKFVSRGPETPAGQIEALLAPPSGPEA